MDLATALLTESTRAAAHMHAAVTAAVTAAARKIATLAYPPLTHQLPSPSASICASPVVLLLSLL